MLQRHTKESLNLSDPCWLAIAFIYGQIDCIMRWLMVFLVAILVLLQMRLWFGEGSISNKIALDRQWETQQQINQEHKLRNRLIAQEVQSLKTNLDSLEEKARKDLGMIKDGEVFYLVIDKNKQSATDRAEP